MKTRKKSEMTHLERITSYVEYLIASREHHALIVEGPPGWGKSEATEKCLKRLGVEYVAIGSYSTPLHFHNSLVEHSDGVLVLDDCAGLFTNLTALSLLKAATWTNAGGDGKRVVTWGSTSEKVAEPSVEFAGKLILLTNVLPLGIEGEALRSRVIHYKMDFDQHQVADLLQAAARDARYFPDTRRAVEVADYLTDRIERREWRQISLRTLKMGYSFAKE